MRCDYSEEGVMDYIRVIYEQDEDTWVASSPEVPNWTVVADSYEDAHRLAEEGVRFALDRDDVDVKHFVPAPAA
jgi:predicted RNase H-like HicB family nuclease